MGIQIPLGSLKYFKKKEQSQYTFDDLIGVSIKAENDGVIDGLTLIFNDGHNDRYVDSSASENKIKQEIDYIQSLYKETFVIESEEDIKRVKDGAKITLVNGNESYVCALNDPADSFCVLHSDYNLDMFTLKGATVEQSRND